MACAGAYPWVMPSADEIQGRWHETRVEIDAPVDVVWHALTDPAAIARWFAPKTTVQPGAGGHIVADWGPGLEWRTDIDLWEPNRRLRLVESRDRVMSASPVEKRLEPCRLVQDYRLEAAGNRTVLSLVHSGFGEGAAWGKEYEGTRGGWAGCFLRLKHGLERHRGAAVHNTIITSACEGQDYLTVLERIERAVPTPFEIVLRGKYEFTALLHGWNGSLLSASAIPSATGSIAYIELVLFGLPRAEATAAEWRAKMEGLFSKA